MIEGGVAEDDDPHACCATSTRRSWPSRRTCCATIGRQLEREYPEAKVEVDDHEAVPQHAGRDGARSRGRCRSPLEAVRRAGLEPKQQIIRGGTDGAHLTEMGLPTPNLSSGEHNLHSPLEWTCLEEMEANVRTVIELLKVWAGR